MAINAMYIDKKNGTGVPNRGSSRTQGTDSYRYKYTHLFSNNKQNNEKNYLFLQKLALQHP